MIGYIEQGINAIWGGKPKAAQPRPASLFYRKGENMGIEGIPFNLFISEEHKLAFRIGDHPLQNGLTVSDHVIREMREVSIEAMFTNRPINKLGGITEVTFKETYGTEEILDSVSNTALENFEKLRTLASKKEPVRIVCSLEVYPKMVITNIDYNRDEKSGDSIRFKMTLREVVQVDLKSFKSDVVFNPENMNDDRKRLIASLKNGGKQSAIVKEADELARLLNTEVAS